MSDAQYKISAVLVILFVGIGAQAADQTYVITAEQWAVPRRAETLLRMPTVAAAMQELRKHSRSHLRIRYPGGDEGTFWAHELRGWLVSLGISSQRIELSPGSANDDVIELDVILDQADQGR